MSRIIPPNIRDAVFQQSNYHCEYCGQDLVGTIDAWRFMIIDHIRPVSKGGSSEIENLAAGCTQCNNLKWDYAPMGNTRAEQITDATKYIQAKRDQEIVRWQEFRASVREQSREQAKTEISHTSPALSK
jgi:CRISPR/Cas system Type II protein with McrA/HNH and RuvC-like nuclease domain